MEQTPVQSGAATPGPWATHPRFPLCVVPLAHAGRPLGAAEDGDFDRYHYAQNIATLYPDRHGRGSAQANARLIAAAPELLKVVTAYIRYMDDPDAGSLVIEDTLQRDMRAAISKATGGTL